MKHDLLFWHDQKWHVYALTAMPDLVHVLALALEAAPGQWYALGEILHSVKKWSARRVNARRGTRGALWQPETHDRLVRDEREFDEEFGYILNNAPRRELVDDGYAYDGFWCEGFGVPPGLRTGRPGMLPRRPAAERVLPNRLVVHRRDLPHWQQVGSVSFVAFGLKEWRVSDTSSLSPR